MKVVVLGAGDVGYGVAKQLSFDEHDVSIIDSDPEILKKTGEKLDVRTVLGNAVDVDVLKEAGADDANIIIAATSTDEINIAACNIADFIFGIETKVARLSNRSYFMHHELFGKGKFPIDLIASPEIETSSIVLRSLSVYGAIDVIPCIDDMLRVVGVECNRNSAFVNTQIKFVPNIANDIEIAIMFIERNGKSFIPNKSDLIMEHDKVYLVVKKDDLEKIMTIFGYSRKKMNNVVIIGGGIVGEELANSIQSYTAAASIKIIERNMDRAERLSEKLGNDIEILYGDSLESEIMEESRMGEADIVISVTKNDKVNILSCLLAKKRGAHRVAAMVNEISSVSILHSLGINTILDSRKAVVSKILHYIQKGGMDNIFTFADNSIEMLSIRVADNSRAIGLLVDEIFKDGDILIASIVRNDKVIMYPRKMVINSGDKILFVAKKGVASKITSVFKEKPKYLI